MRSSRLVALLLHLQHHGRATAPQLAELLEVSTRTIYRDISALQGAGVPLWTEPGPNGGVRMLEGWRTRLDGLTADEAGTLFLAGVPAAATELGLGTVLAAAQVKVLATLPPELRGRASRVRERFFLDAPGWFRRAEAAPHLGVVAEAVWGDRRLDVRYRLSGPAERVVERQLDPLGLVLKAGTWYLVAGAERGQVRTYRLGRVVAAEPRDERFERPAGFDLAEWWAASTAEFDRSLLRARVRLRLSPGARRLLPQLVDPAAADEALAAAGPADGEGWQEVDLAVESDEVALHQLTGLGSGVEVLAPATLRAAFAGVGAAMAGRNAPAAG